MTSRPARTRSPSSSTKCLAVEPVPRPSRMPGVTNSRARAAAARFCVVGIHGSDTEGQRLISSRLLAAVGNRPPVYLAPFARPEQPQKPFVNGYIGGQQSALHRARPAVSDAAMSAPARSAPCSSSTSTARWSTPRPIWSPRSTSSWRAKACRRSPYETARNFVGGGARLMLARGIKADGRIVEPARARPHVHRFHRLLCRHMSPMHSRPFPGARPKRSILSRTAATASRSAPTSSNSCRCCCSNALETRPAASRRSAGRTPSPSPSPIRKFCAAPSPPPAATSAAPSWSAIPKPTS